MAISKKTIALLLAAFAIPGAGALTYALAMTSQHGPSPKVKEGLGDLVSIKESPYLAHLAEALPKGDYEVRRLLGPDALPYEKAPDPSSLLQRMRADNLARPVNPAATPLRILTYNTGLLDRVKILGRFGRVTVPEIDARRKAMAEMILAEGYDIYLLQEVWEASDSEAISRAAEAKGYVAYNGSPGHQPEHGLLILLKRSLVEGASEISKGEYQYHHQYGLEFWPGPSIRRGYIWMALDHETLGPIRIVNTHLTAFPGFWAIRAEQSRELALTIEPMSAPGELLFVGGDMNAGPYYPQDTWTFFDGKTEAGWWSNTQSYALLLHYLQGVDLMAMGADPMDVRLWEGVSLDASKLKETPLGVPDYCQGEGNTAFSATDCNGLYYRNYGGTEYPARLDHIIAKDLNKRLRVKRAGLTFTEIRSLPGGVKAELSDHYGVAVEVEVAPLVTPGVTPEIAPAGE